MYLVEVHLFFCLDHLLVDELLHLLDTLLLILILLDIVFYLLVHYHEQSKVLQHVHELIVLAFVPHWD
jgi:hypothetical protein